MDHMVSNALANRAAIGKKELLIGGGKRLELCLRLR
jgi:hypothetical protein